MNNYLLTIVMLLFGMVSAKATDDPPCPLLAIACEGDGITLVADATLISSGFTNYQWYKGSVAPGNEIVGATNDTLVLLNLQLGDAGDYYFSSTDNTGCEQSSCCPVKLGVEKVDAQADNDGPVCEGSSVGLSASTGSNNATFAWSGPGTLSNPNTANASLPTATPNQSGVYTVTVTNENGCTATATTEVVVNPNPTITIAAGPTCAPNLLTYSVTVSLSSGAGLMTNGGTATDNGNGTWTVSGIPAGQNVLLTAATDEHCETDLSVNAPDCSCPTVNPPTGQGAEICENETIPALTVMVGNGETADWYDAAMGGNLLADNTTSFTPNAAGTYYAETQDITTGCVSSTRTEVTLHIYDNPTIMVEDPAACAANLQTYAVTVSISAGSTLTSDFGTVTDNGNGTMTVSGIPAGQDVTLTATAMTSNCEGHLTVNAPDCSCPTVNPPTGQGAEICENETIPALTVTVGNGETADWYDAAMAVTCWPTTRPLSLPAQPARITPKRKT